MSILRMKTSVLQKSKLVQSSLGYARKYQPSTEEKNNVSMYLLSERDDRQVYEDL